MRSSSTNTVTPDAPSALRQIIESSVLLALAVILFRTFAAEGYLISTGSMAPCLLGYHKRVVCPCCHCLFARGAAFDADQSKTFAHASGDGFLGWANEPVRETTTCPNCGQTGIDTADLPRNEGDQLLVHKFAYEFRDPRRWEVIVFQSNSEPHQPYCKRVVGLPDEEIRVHDGDIFADGILQRKPHEVQQSIRIPVWNNDFQPEEASIPLRWLPLQEESGWKREGNNFVFVPTAEMAAGTLVYEHWIQAGGRHWTSVPLASWPQEIDVPDEPNAVLRYSQESGRLFASGVLSPLELQQWQSLSDNPEWHVALDELARRSHFGPIADDYGYNAEGTRESNVVHDLQVELLLTPNGRHGRFEILVSDGGDEFTLVLNFADRQLELLANGDPVPLRTAPFTPLMREPQFTVSLSTFDRQVIAAVGGEPVFEPLLYGERESARRPLSRPARLIAAGGEFRVEHLSLYRDVYYTAKGQESGVDPGYTLADNEFYVLGDNSPVSVDSRVWEHPAITRDALIGKPLIVHLPSRQGEIQFAGQTRYVRIPDFSRVRYIR